MARDIPGDKPASEWKAESRVMLIYAVVNADYAGGISFASVSDFQNRGTLGIGNSGQSGVIFFEIRLM